MQDFQPINQSIKQTLHYLNALGSSFILLNSFMDQLLLTGDFVDLFSRKFIHHACGHRFVSFTAQMCRILVLMGTLTFLWLKGALSLSLSLSLSTYVHVNEKIDNYTVDG